MLTIYHAHEVRLVSLVVTLHIDNNSDERIHGDVVDATLQMKLQVFSLVTEKLALFDYDADLLGKPPWGGPQQPVFVFSDSSVDGEDGGYVVYGLARLEQLVRLTPIAISPGSLLALHSTLEHLGEGDAGGSASPRQRLGWKWVDQAVHLRCLLLRRLNSTMQTSNRVRRRYRHNPGKHLTQIHWG